MSEQGSQDHPNTASSPRKKLDWEFRLGRQLVLLILFLVGGSFTLAMILSIYRSITAPPQVWGTSNSTSKQGIQRLKRGRIKVCRQYLEQLHTEQARETTALWYRMRRGHRGHLTLWEEWSRDWKHRMLRLQKQCTMLSSKTSPSHPTKTLSLRTCTQQFARLNKELQSKSSTLWLKARQGSKHYLKGWQDWSRSWQRRMHLWLQRCPIHGENDIAQAFRRAHSKMLILQRRQEKALLAFFKSSSGLFRDIRQSLYNLKEELR